MLVITIFMLDLPFVRSDERQLARLTTLLKDVILGTDQSVMDDFLFLNVSNNKELIYNNDEGVEGNEAVTDRKKIAGLLDFLSKNKTAFKYVLCDISFDGDSPNDSLLECQFDKLKGKIIIPSVPNGANTKFPAATGLADYVAVEDVFVKYRLMEKDSNGNIHKSIPLQMFIDINKSRYENSTFYPRFNDRAGFNNFILNMRIRHEDLHNSGYCLYFSNLNQLLDSEMPDSVRLSFVKNRIIVIGDFEDRKNDFHKSLTGEIPGALILTNAYIALNKGDNIIPLLLFPFLLVCFIGISHFILSPVNVIKAIASRLIKKINFSIMDDLIIDIFSYATMLYFVSASCVFIFNIQINIMYLLIYIVALEKIFHIIDEKYKLNLIK